MATKLILLDLDGTLVDTVNDITNALNYALDGRGLRTLSVGEVKYLIGEGINRLIEKVLGEERIHVKDAVVTRFLDHYSKHLADNSTVYPYVRETLEKLTSYRKAVISNKREYLSTELLKKLDILKYFDLIIGSDTTSERKPSPIPVIYALSKFNAEPSEAVMVGDINYDIEAGRRAGIMTIAVAYGYGERRYLLDADAVVDNFGDLCAFLT